MKTSLATTNAARVAADLLVIPITGRELRAPAAVAVDQALQGRLLREARRQGLADEPDATFLFQTHGALPARHVLLLRTGPTSSAVTWHKVADAASRSARELRVSSVAVALDASVTAASAGLLVEGIALADYRFTRYRSRPDDTPPLSLVLLVPVSSASFRQAVSRAEILARAACFARDLVNTPAAELTPTALAEEARRIAKGGLSLKLHGRRQIERMGMGALLGVARGSAEPPWFIELIYRPPRAARRRVALVGKGVTFDSGGLSLKNAEAMRTQKRDMAGGATVLAAMSALPGLKPRVEVRGYVPAAENMPGGAAIKPGDVVRAFNGKTIEVLNTDAEGRLLLADALSYASTKRPDLIIDFATLTAAVNTALGSRYAAILGTSAELISAVIGAGTSAAENFWQLPLVTEYRRDLDSTVADLKNTGEGQAGTIIGALFLREFVGDIAWAHVDFSSTAVTAGHPCHPKGATGFGVRTVLRYLSQL